MKREPESRKKGPTATGRKTKTDLECNHKTRERKSIERRRPMVIGTQESRTGNTTMGSEEEKYTSG